MPDRTEPAPSARASTPSSGAPAPERATGDAQFPLVDRRSGIDRRDLQGPTTGLERRRGPGRRLSDFTKSAEEGELNREQFLFIMAIDNFKKVNQRAFPTWTDILEVIRLLGYRKTMPSELNLTSAEDWREPPHAPANVRAGRWDAWCRIDQSRSGDASARDAA